MALAEHSTYALCSAGDDRDHLSVLKRRSKTFSDPLGAVLLQTSSCTRKLSFDRGSFLETKDHANAECLAQWIPCEAPPLLFDCVLLFFGRGPIRKKFADTRADTCATEHRSWRSETRCGDAFRATARSRETLPSSRQLSLAIRRVFIQTSFPTRM